MSASTGECSPIIPPRPVFSIVTEMALSNHLFLPPSIPVATFRIWASTAGSRNGSEVGIEGRVYGSSERVNSDESMLLNVSRFLGDRRSNRSRFFDV
jgi:hypothetical protein